MNELMMSAEDLRNHNRVMALILEHARQGESFTALGKDENHVNQLRESAKALLMTQNVRFNLDSTNDFLLRSGEKIEFKLASEMADPLSAAAGGFGTVESFLNKTVDEQLNILTTENTSPILNAAATESVIKHRENPAFILNPANKQENTAVAGAVGMAKIVPPPYIEPPSMEDRRKVGLVKDVDPGVMPPPAKRTMASTAEETNRMIEAAKEVSTLPATEAKTVDPLSVFTNDEEEMESPDQWGKGFRQDPNIEVERTANAVKITNKGMKQPNYPTKTR